MFNFAGVAEGFSTQAENRRRQRMELAKAFELFKQNNPYATAADFQGWIDQNVGDSMGSGYLRGGLPGSEVLQRLGSANAERKARDDQRAALEMLRDKATTTGQVNALIDDFLFGYTGDIGDARAAFETQYGINPTTIGMDFTGQFTSARQQDVIATRIQPHLNTALDLIKRSNGQIDNEALRSLTGINNPTALNSLVQQAQQEYDRYISTWTLQNNERVISEITRLMGTGAQEGEIRNHVENLLAGTGIDISRFDFTSANRAAQEVYDRQQEDRENALRDRTRAAFRDFEATLQSSAVQRQIQNMLVSGDEAGLRELIRQRARATFGQDYDTFMGANPDEVVNRYAADFIADAQGQQERDLQTARDTAGVTARETVNQRIEANQNETAEFFKMYGDGAATFAADLARRYYVDAGLRAALMQALGNMPDDVKSSGNPTQIAEYLNSQIGPYLAQHGTPVEDYRAGVMDAQMAASGGFDAQSFNSWASEWNSGLDGNVASYQQDLATAAQITDPARKVAYLQALLTDLDRFNATQTARLRARSQNREHWVLPGSGGFDRDAFNTMSGAYENAIAGLRQTINQQLATAQEAANNQALLPEPTEYVSPDRSSAGQVWDDHVAYADAVNQIASAAGFAFRDSGTANPLASAWDLVAAPFRLASREVNENFVMSAADERRAENMREFLLANDRAIVTVYQNIPAQRQQELLADVQNLTAEQFRQKYDADLRKAGDGTYRAMTSFMPFTE